METATVAQAEPQGSAAATQDTSAPASGTPPASGDSFGSLFRQHVERRASRAGASSAEPRTSATDEQPAPSSRTASRPGAAPADVDGTASGDAEPSSPTDQPRLTRAERKAQRLGQSSEPPTADASSTDTAGAATPAAPAGEPTTASSSDDPIAARVAQVEKTVTEGLSRLEGLLSRPTPAQADPDENARSADYRKRYGDDAEFKRRADIALHGSQRGEYLDVSEADELAVWSQNRETRDIEAAQASARVNQQYQSQFSAVVLAAAEAFGVSPESIQKPGTTFKDIFGAFVSQGESRKAPELTAANERIASLEAANRLLADENEALLKRSPGLSRPVLNGGAASSSRAAALADRSRMDGRQAMRAGLTKQMTGRPNRPGAR